MYKAKAVTGEYAGEPIEADKTGLTPRICRKWKFYCPECYQFVHWRKSENKENCFAHYDVEDKNCKYRVTSSSNNAAVNINSNDSQEQDLEGIQKDFEAIFSSIDIYYDKITRIINNIPYLKYIANEIKNKFIKLDANKNIKQEWKELEEWIQNNSSNNPEHCIAVLNILSIDMNRHILEKLIHYAIYYVVLESFELIPSLTRANEIKARIELNKNKEDFLNKSIEKILQITIDIDWRSGQKIRTNLEYQPYVSNFNRGDGSSSLSINEYYSIISCEKSIYSVIDKRKNSELFKLELNYEKGVNFKLQISASAFPDLFYRLMSQDLFFQLIWKIINSGNVQWFMLAVGILASQKKQGDISTVNFIDPTQPLPLSDKEWIDSINQVIKDIREEIYEIPVNLRQQIDLNKLQNMLSVAEQELQKLGIIYKFSMDVIF